MRQTLCYMLGIHDKLSKTLSLMELIYHKVSAQRAVILVLAEKCSTNYQPVG